MQQLDRLIRKAAASNASVLILGETGTGKGLAASAIHQLSRRSSKPFLKVNCAARSETWLESELFGHLGGSFDGAIDDRPGAFERADGGSLLLSEVNASTMTLQVKLLRLLQENAFERVGDTTSRRTDVRVIAASDRDLLRQVHSGSFREDLYWRLNVIPIEIPALRHRREDIPALVSFFLDHYNEGNDRYVTHLGPKVMRSFQEYHWPGNVRELQNYIERAVVMSDTDELTFDLLPSCVTSGEGFPGRIPGAVHGHPSSFHRSDSDSAEGSLVQDASQEGISSVNPATYADRMDAKTLTRFVVARGLAETDEDENVHAAVVDQVEKELIAQVLAQCSGVQTKAAARLGMNRNTLYKKIKQYGLGPPPASGQSSSSGGMNK